MARSVHTGTLTTHTYTLTCLHPLPARLLAPRCFRRCCRAPRTDLTPEQRESLGKSLFSDFLSSPSVDEAVGTAQELEAPGFLPKLVQLGLEKVFEVQTAREQGVLVDLLCALAARGVLGGGPYTVTRGTLLRRSYRYLAGGRQGGGGLV